MLSLLRAGVSAALLIVAPLAASAADKPFQNKELADSAITLEAQIKSDAGTQSKPVAQVRRDADAAFSRNDFRAGMALLGQVVAAAPNDTATWLRLARAIMQIRPADDKERKLLLERASTAAYIAYQRTTSRAEEADSLAFLGNVLAHREEWRPALDALRLSLELREVADVRGQYERLREQYAPGGRCGHGHGGRGHAELLLEVLQQLAQLDHREFGDPVEDLFFGQGCHLPGLPFFASVLVGFLGTGACYSDDSSAGAAASGAASVSAAASTGASSAGTSSAGAASAGATSAAASAGAVGAPQSAFIPSFGEYLTQVCPD